MTSLDLSGEWRVAPADEALRRDYPSPGFDDSSWDGMAVPSHWRSHEAFADSDGPLLFRRRFSSEPMAEGRRAWLRFDGVFYQSDVWLDGSYVGDTEGYFAPHLFEVTDSLASGGDHVVAVEVTCSRPGDLGAKRNITGVFQHWDCIDPRWNPGGIWRPVTVEESGPARITSMRVLCPEASPERAVVRLRANIDTTVAGPVRLETSVGSRSFSETKELAAGENRVQWDVEVPEPGLWWPRALGSPELTDVTVALVLDDGSESDRRSVRTGIRAVSMRRWILSVNGERLYCKGTNLGPARMDLAAASPDELVAAVRTAHAAGLDMIRIHGHVTRSEVYDEADRLGLLVWQDFPLQWSYARGIRKQAAEQARAMVDLLSHHPSIAVWCGHNEPVAHRGDEPGDVEAPAVDARTVALHGLPSWNKSVLDASVKRAIERADGTRPVIPHSGVLPHPGSAGTDTHLYFGWYGGDERDLARAISLWPNLGRFVSEFGAQAVPDSADFMEPDRWPDLDWERIERVHGLQLDAFGRLGLGPSEFATFDQWRSATQRYQADLVRRQIEALRRVKYRPGGGFCHFLLNDCHPAVSWAAVDSTGTAKPSLTALTEACAPVIVVADRPAAVVLPGDPLALDIHVVSDRRTPLAGAQLDALMTWEGGDHSWSFTGDIPADDCVRVSTLQAVVPDAPGPLTLELRLTAGEVAATNRYSSVIAAS